jgi:hypothetical protein
MDQKRGHHANGTVHGDRACTTVVGVRDHGRLSSRQTRTVSVPDRCSIITSYCNCPRQTDATGSCPPQ